MSDYHYRSSGFSLLYVITLLLLVSAIAYVEVNFRVQQSYTTALELTVAQTDSLLNEAYAYYLKNNKWPGTGSDCQSWADQHANGWGVAVRCEYATAIGPGTIDAGNANDFMIRQYVPKELGDTYASRFLDSDVLPVSGATASADNPPKEFVGYTVKTDRSGGTDKKLEFGSLSNSGGPLVDDLQCVAPMNSISFGALGGMESELNTPGKVVFNEFVFPWSCVVDFDVEVPEMRNGFRVQTRSIGSVADFWAYDMHRRDFDFAPLLGFFEKGFTYDYMHPYILGACDQYKDSENYENDDGNYNANHRAHGKYIDIAMFYYCE